jgi:hypothetical protein
VSKHEHDSTAEYRSLTGGFADLKAIVSGWARNPTELWLQVTDAGLIDQDGTVLYKSDAPEFELSEKMWWYAQFAQSLYKGTKLYPINSTKYLSTPGFLYSNPFSGKSDHAEILLKRFAAADKTWTQSVKSGKKWDGEPVWRPGAIDCMCLDYCRFFIRGLDRNGQPLTSAEPGQTFAIELKDGVSSTQSEWKALAAAEASNRSAAPVHVFISASPGIQLFASTIRVMIPILLWVAFGLSVVFAIHMSKSGKFDIFIAALPICFLSMLALWYYYSLAAPW